jgi:hypothetical protein
VVNTYKTFDSSSHVYASFNLLSNHPLPNSPFPCCIPQPSIKMADMFMPAPEPKTELGRYRVLSRTAGVRVSPLQLGAMSIGDAWVKFMGSMDRAQSFSKLFWFSSKYALLLP